MSGDLLTVWEGQAVPFWADLWNLPRLEVHGRLTSTNDRARTLSEEGWGPYATVIADEQTAGRGRTGAPWHSAAGSGLWISVLLPATPAPHLPLLVGLAAAEAIERVHPEIRPRIEWPNDLTVRDRKVGGILCEGVGVHVVAGLGINTHEPPGGFPPELADRATSLNVERRGHADRPALAGALLAELRRRMAVAGPKLSAEERLALSQRDALEGRVVVSAQHGHGRAVEIAEDGALLMEREDGTRVQVRSGHVRPAS
ncbi:MAG: biotin--[acetyl-CoA-carboxylase] ligase [Gemmatimonadota bacterium]|nr:biotin--[acetyl-CoA-carboxylase] ligase [Gemmatimonadota bacterium]